MLLTQRCRYPAQMPLLALESYIQLPVRYNPLNVSQTFKNLLCHKYNSWCISHPRFEHPLVVLLLFWELVLEM